MNRRSSPKDKDDLKTRIKKLVTLEQGECPPGSSQKPSKYARVLTCSFVREGGHRSGRQKEEPRIVSFQDATTKQEASIK
jgi:hypothetical protein